MRKHRSHINFMLPAGLLFMLLWLLLFVRLADGLQKNSYYDQELSLEQALDHAITSCYALEGAYPPDLQYMKDHYGLTYDESLFYVSYQPIASNIRPSYHIIQIDNSAAGGADS